MKLTEEQKYFLDSVCGGGRKSWKLQPNGKVNVKGNVTLYDMDIEEIPVKFGRVELNFDCSYNKLTTFKNCPDYIGGHFWGENNNIKSLEYYPKEVCGKFIINYNPIIKNLEYVYKDKKFKLWDKLDWTDIFNYNPKMINIAKKYLSVEHIRKILIEYPLTKLYLK
jgi:hypothetical protein